VRIDPARFKLDLYSAIGLKLADALPIDVWARQQGWRPASMRHVRIRRPRHDRLRRVGEVVLNPVWSPNYNAVLALAPDDLKLPAATILDPMRRRQSLWKALPRRATEHPDGGLQGRQPLAEIGRVWSTAALAIDDQGRVLFIHARVALDVHDLIDMLLELRSASVVPCISRAARRPACR